MPTFVDGYGGDVNTAEDVLLREDFPHLHLGDHNNFNLTTNMGGYQKGLLRFNLSSIPSGSTCTSAKLYLYHGFPPEVDVDAQVYVWSLTNANKDWVEADTTLDPAPAGACSWAGKVEDGSGNVTTPWAGSEGIGTSGTDYEASAIAGPVTVNSNNALGYEYIFDLDTDRIEGWFGASNTNYTIAIWSVDNGAGHLASSDHATTAYRPRLEVEYTEASAVTITVTVTVTVTVVAMV